MQECKCPQPLREGGHEWWCGAVGEYDYVHCKACDRSVWMCEVACSLCRNCRLMSDDILVRKILT
jgi:hypothetical protein